MKRLILLLSLAGALSAQTVVNIKSLTVNADGVSALNKFFLTQLTATPTVLNGALASGATTITVVDGSVAAQTDVFVIDNEAFQITAKAGKVFTVTPAAFGTTTAAHSDNATVGVMRYKNYALFGQQVFADVVTSLMDRFGFPSGAAQDATIATAQAAKAAAKAAAVQ